MKYFTISIFEEIAANTNTYTASYRAGQPGSRAWRLVQAGYIIIWIGIVIYMGTWKLGIREEL
jgi:hypothetical protein